MAETEQELPEARKRRWYFRRDARFLIFVGLCMSVYYGYGFVTGPARISDRLQAALEQNPDQPVNIVVTSKFPPEAFHLNIYQDLGSTRGSEGNYAVLHKVWPASVRKLSRYYWVEKVDLENGPKPKKN